MLFLLFSLFIEIELKEQTPLEHARVTRLITTAQGNGTVLLQWADIKLQQGLAIHNGFYDFKSETFWLLKDARLDGIARSIVYTGTQYVIWHGERGIVLDNNGAFKGVKWLNRFKGWETELRIETMVSDGKRVLASGHFQRQDGTHLIEIDFENESLNFGHTFFEERIDRSRRYVPFGDGFLQIEQHGGEILRLDRNYQKLAVLRKRRPVVEALSSSAASRALGHRGPLKPIADPFSVSGVGLSCRYLKLHDEAGERLDVAQVKALIISKQGKVRIQDSFVLGSDGSKQLVYDAGQQVIRLHK